MNKIIIGSNYEIESDYKHIVVDQNILKIVVKKSVELQLEWNGQNTFQTIEVIVEENSHLYLLDTKYQMHDKEYVYNIALKENSTLEYDRYNNIDEVEETMNVYLEGRDSRIEIHHATVSNNNQLLTQNIYHKKEDTTSHVVNRGISGKGNVNFHVNTYVSKGSIRSVVNQNSKIIMLENNKSSIQPNLYIDENDVVANHGASIGKFSHQELFYLQSRGLTKEDSMQLLMEAFLLHGMKANAKKEIENIIKKEGRMEI